MSGFPVRMTPAEAVFLAMVVVAPMQVIAQDVTPPDAALLEFLADWNEADGDWLEAELNTEMNSGATDVGSDATQPASRAEKDHE